MEANGSAERSGAVRCLGCAEVARTGALNRLPDGSICPICASRAAESQPSLLPSGFLGHRSPSVAVSDPGDEVGPASFELLRGGSHRFVPRILRAEHTPPPEPA